MSAVYLETSALLAWLLGEPEARTVADRVDAAEVVVTSALTVTEAERALLRGVATGALPEADANRLRGLLARVVASWMVMSVTERVLARAGGAFPVEPVRTLDAVHLATALAFTEAFPELTLLALDRRVATNASVLGLATPLS